MEAFYVCASKKECGVSGAADIKIGRVSTVNSMEITHRNCRPCRFSPKKNALRSQHYVSRPIQRLAVSAGMRERFVPCQQFDPARYGEFHHLIEARLRGDPSRMRRTQKAGFKLDIANRGEGRRRRDSWPTGVGNRLVRLLLRGDGKRESQKNS